MTSEISLSMALRLRNNAKPLNRSAEQNRRAVSTAETKLLLDQLDQFYLADAQREAEVEASVADIQKRVADTQKHFAEARSRQNITAAQPAVPASLLNSLSLLNRSCLPNGPNLLGRPSLLNRSSLPCQSHLT